MKDGKKSKFLFGNLSSLVMMGAQLGYNFFWIFFIFKEITTLLKTFGIPSNFQQISTEILIPSHHTLTLTHIQRANHPILLIFSISFYQSAVLNWALLWKFSCNISFWFDRTILLSNRRVCCICPLILSDFVYVCTEKYTKKYII